MCLHLGGAPEFNLPWELDKLFIAYDGALRPLSATTPTPVEKGTAYPWLHFLSSKGLATYEGPRDLGHSWFVDQVAGPENLMAAESKDGERLIGYTWDDAPGVLMSNCGNPCLHTGTDASPVLEAGESHRWRGKVYFTSNDRPALLERVRRDRRSWAEE
jgi:hypothetical protein